MKLKYRITAELTVSQAIEIEITSLKGLHAAQVEAMTRLRKNLRDKIEGEFTKPNIRFEQISLRPTDRKY